MNVKQINKTADEIMEESCKPSIYGCYTKQSILAAMELYASQYQYPVQIKNDDKIINHVRNVKLLQAVYKGKKFFVECFPTDIGAVTFPNTNFAVKEIDLPDFDLFEEKLGFRWLKVD